MTNKEMLEKVGEHIECIKTMMKSAKLKPGDRECVLIIHVTPDEKSKTGAYCNTTCWSNSETLINGLVSYAEGDDHLIKVFEEIVYELKNRDKGPRPGESFENYMMRRLESDDNPIAKMMREVFEERKIGKN